jgi:hypothetical protein
MAIPPSRPERPQGGGRSGSQGGPKGTAQRREASWTAASTTPSSTGRDHTDAPRAVATCPHGKARKSDRRIRIMAEAKITVYARIFTAVNNYTGTDYHRSWRRWTNV